MTFDHTNRGSIWKNEKKKEDKHPDFTGTLNVEGVEYWVSAWRRKEGAAAKAPALTFSIKPKEAKRSAAGEYENERRQDKQQAEHIEQQPRGARRSSAEMDEEIPW